MKGLKIWLRMTISRNNKRDQSSLWPSFEPPSLSSSSISLLCVIHSLESTYIHRKKKSPRHLFNWESEIRCSSPPSFTFCLLLSKCVWEDFSHKHSLRYLSLHCVCHFQCEDIHSRGRQSTNRVIVSEYIRCCASNYGDVVVLSPPSFTCVSLFSFVTFFLLCHLFDSDSWSCEPERMTRKWPVNTAGNKTISGAVWTKDSKI
jgi:hypothetical protein